MAVKMSIFLFAIALHLNLSGQVKDCLEGDNLMAQQNYMLAAEKYVLCYKMDTMDKSPLAALANCYQHLGDYALAKRYFHQIENDSFYRTEAIAKLAVIYESQQNLPKAIKYYLALQKLYPQNPVYYRKLGNLYMQGREPKQAFESYQQANQLNPRDILTLQSLTEIYMTSDELDKSDSIANIGLAIDSTNIGLLLLKARIKYRLRDYSSTAHILNKLVTQTELNNYYNKLLGYSMMQIDSLDKAIHYLQKSLIDENDPEYALYYLALAHEKKKEYDRAEWFFQEAAKTGISENMAQYYSGLARVSSHQEDYKLVIDYYKKSLAYQKDPKVYFYMANAAEHYYKDKTKAIDYYNLYLNSKHNNQEFIKIAIERVKTLKAKEFMKRKSNS